MDKNRQTARFIEQMECLPVDKIPEGSGWTYELKLDGYRIEAIKTSGKVSLYSRRGHDLTQRFDSIARALQSVPDDTVIDGELVALDEQGRPSFNLLQNFRSAASHITYYAFDILIHNATSVMELPLSERRVILEEVFPPTAHSGLSQVSNSTAPEMVQFARAWTRRRDREAGR